jgi:hypothetical protein
VHARTRAQTCAEAPWYNLSSYREARSPSSIESHACLRDWARPVKLDIGRQEGRDNAPSCQKTLHAFEWWHEFKPMLLEPRISFQIHPTSHILSCFSKLSGEPRIEFNNCRPLWSNDLEQSEYPSIESPFYYECILLQRDRHLGTTLSI